MEDSEFYLVNPTIVLWHDCSEAELKVGNFNFILESEAQYKKVVSLLGRGLFITADYDFNLKHIGGYVHES
jgi:hypothetical protein